MGGSRGSLPAKLCPTLAILMIASLFTSIKFALALEDKTDHGQPQATSADAGSKPRGKKILSLANSIKATMKTLEDPEEVTRIQRLYWRKTLSDIKKLSLSVGMRKSDPFLSQWKSSLDEEEFEDRKRTAANLPNISTMQSFGDEDKDVKESYASDAPVVSTNGTSSSIARRLVSTKPRFEGFPSWERMLQEWADDVQEYMQEIENESGSEYLLANYGRPSSTRGKTVEEEAMGPLEDEQKTNVTAYALDDDKEEVVVNGKGGSDKGSIRSRSAAMPIPAPPIDGEPVLPHTDLSDKSKRIEIVTTASLPWRTGTAVNPLLRAAYMLEGRIEAGGSVTLMLPWLERQADQARVYGNTLFEAQEDQEAYIRNWLRDEANMPDAARDLQIRWYTAWQNPAENSVYSMGDITALIPAKDVDICILEEPEHLNWYRAPGESWTKKFKHVVGILHTNYFQYALDQPAALVRAPAMRLLCSWMCRAHCHRVIKLSGTIDKVAPEKELVENVHGVRGTFLDVGEEVGRRLRDTSKPDPVFGMDAEPTIYFIGKMLWSKGLGSLMELLKYAEESAGIKVKVDMYGGGPDKDAADNKAVSLDLDMPFHGPVDHAKLDFSHKIFVNPSTSEVLCTTSAEALAMGKFVILPSHISNDFFAQFPNCLSYASKEEFVGNLFYAMTHSPEPLSDQYLHALSWKAATSRLENAGCIPEAEDQQMQEFLSSDEGGVEIPLPPLIDDEQRRKRISTTFRYTRHRYRQFRSRLSSEVLQNTVLPKKLREQVATSLEQQLDLDIDEILESPKLRLKLSPAELDKSLLEFYNSVSASPGGDVLRVIGGGGPVALQNLYMRRQARKERTRGRADISQRFPFIVDDPDDMTENENDRTASEWIRYALRRNLPRRNGLGSAPSKATPSRSTEAKDTTRMSTALNMEQRMHMPRLSTWSGLAPPTNFGRHKTFSLLI